MNAREHAAKAILTAAAGLSADEVAASYIARLERSIARHNADKLATVALANKLACQRKENDAREELRAVRLLIFDIQDEIKDQMHNCRAEEIGQKFQDA